MTLDEVIEKSEMLAHTCDDGQCSELYKQAAEWFKFLKARTNTNTEDKVSCDRQETCGRPDAKDVLQSIDHLRRELSGYHGQLKAHNELQRHCDNQRMRIAELEGLYTKVKAENERLRELVRVIWITARLMDANRHIDGMRITDDFRTECERAFKELGIEVSE